ncbi:lysozyme inhibitor LprI family protein [Caenimonas sp. SL110]|uniref:lysozyme inhibitor LprI family protein n=1 Tax=Caenimonas sp. SL110 TaxID=1450524 RepID=UPI00069FD30F|nr:hypothetical protein [Caenimonas sp. SL110]
MPLFAGGLVAGVALAIALVFVMRPETPQASRPEAAAVPQPIVNEPCGFNAIVKAADKTDGSAAFGSTGPGAALIVRGKEAAAAGRDRDAEAAFLAACKLESPTKDAAAVLLRADAKYNLARHYASLAQEGAANRNELNSRASSLFSESLAVYKAQLGGEHEKVRFATQALALLNDGDGEAARRKERVAAVSRPSAATPVTAPSNVAKEPVEPSVEKPVVRTAEKPIERPAENDTQSDQRPSFDCSRARSQPEKIICADPQLARMDRDLGRVYARAKRAAADPQAFQRVSDREWRRRESECRDRECLVDWYRERREQLVSQGGDDREWNR